jgi:hypothetical protein
MMNCVKQLRDAVGTNGTWLRESFADAANFAEGIGESWAPDLPRRARARRVAQISRRGIQSIDFSPVISILHLFSRVFRPFLSHKGLVSSRLQQKHGFIKFAELRASQNSRESFSRSRSFRTGTRREVGRPRQNRQYWPGLPRIVPPVPALSRVRFFLGQVFLARNAKDANEGQTHTIKHDKGG